MHISRRQIVPALAALVLLGCDGDALGPDAADGPAIRTDRLWYRAARVEGSSGSYEFTIVAVYRNISAETVYLHRCSGAAPFPIYSVGLRSGEPGEFAAYNPAWGCGGGVPPFEIAPGSTRTDTVRLEGPRSWDGVTGEPFGVLWGRFVLGYDARSGPDPGSPELPNELQLSNEFYVHPVNFPLR